MPTAPNNTRDKTPAGVQHLEGQSKYYLVSITSSQWGDVFAWLPDNTQLLVRSSWAPITGNIVSSLVNFATAKVANLFGNDNITLVSKRLTAQEWQGAEPLDVQLQLHFFATLDAGIEVIEPLKRLMKMALPRKRGTDTSDSFLVAPGPIAQIFGDKSQADPQHGDRINVYIGNFCRLTDVFVSSISGIDFLGKLSTDGIPMEAVCTIVFRTLFAPIAEDIDDYFSAPSIGGTGFGAPSYPD